MLGYLAGTVADESNETRTAGNVKARICLAVLQLFQEIAEEPSPCSGSKMA